ncbi:MAG: hypothetical protein KDC12_15575 [Flavobacteriales bacterium]|nr:hypothetical protein [Flavobacteriales bacterium]
MVNVQLKLVDEGLSPNSEEISEFVTSNLQEDDIHVTDSADLTLKIKFTVDNDQELVLLQLRETGSKAKLGEKVLHYLPSHALSDIANEAHALVVNAVGIAAAG